MADALRTSFGGRVATLIFIDILIIAGLVLSLNADLITVQTVVTVGSVMVLLNVVLFFTFLGRSAPIPIGESSVDRLKRAISVLDSSVKQPFVLNQIARTGNTAFSF